jgi:hypothetical protein
MNRIAEKRTAPQSTSSAKGYFEKATKLEQILLV